MGYRILYLGPKPFNELSVSFQMKFKVFSTILHTICLLLIHDLYCSLLIAPLLKPVTEPSQTPWHTWLPHSTSSFNLSLLSLHYLYCSPYSVLLSSICLMFPFDKNLPCFLKSKDNIIFLYICKSQCSGLQVSVVETETFSFLFFLNKKMPHESKEMWGVDISL